MKIHEYASKIISITYHRIKGICLSLRMRSSSMVYDKKKKQQQLRYFQFSMCTPIIIDAKIEHLE